MDSLTEEIHSAYAHIIWDVFERSKASLEMMLMLLKFENIDCWNVAYIMLNTICYFNDPKLEQVLKYSEMIDKN